MKTKRLKFLPLKLENKENYLEVNINNKLSLVEQIRSYLDDLKAQNISTINLKNKSSIADYFVIATCRSSRHANATADEIIKKLKKIGVKCPIPSGKPKCDWVIVDTGSILIHLFRSEIREIYNLEKLWEINFDKEENINA